MEIEKLIHSSESISIYVDVLGEQSAGAKGDEVQFRFEDEFGRPVFDNRLNLNSTETVKDGSGGNGVFFKILGKQDLTFDIPKNWSIIFLCHPWSGLARLRIESRSVTLNLFSPTHRIRKFRLSNIDSIDPENLSPGRFVHSSAAVIGGHSDLTGKAIATCCPRWRGVAASTQQLFEHVFLLPSRMDRTPQSLSLTEIEYAAEAIVNREPDCVVISGGDEIFSSLATHIKLLRPKTRIYLLWHSNFLQLGEAHDFRLLTWWINQYRQGSIDGIGVVKEGLEKLFASIGVPSFFVENVNSAPFVSELISEVDAPVNSTGIHVGMWLSGSSSYRKRPHVMLASMSLLKTRGVRLSCSGLTKEGMEVANALGLEFEFVSSSEISHTHLMARMSSMSVNIYVTLSECSPMLPLESWSVGVPFIIGPSCKLVSESEYLRNNIVVYDPSDPFEIAEKVIFAANNRENIMQELDKVFLQKYKATSETLRRIIHLENN